MDMVMWDMAMEAMDTMATMARGLLRLSQAMAMDMAMDMEDMGMVMDMEDMDMVMDMEDMVDMAMEVMDTMATMVRDLLMLSQAMAMDMAMDMEDMGMVMDMEDMDMEDMDMEDMDMGDMDMEDMDMEDMVMDMVMGTMDKRERNIQSLVIVVHQEFTELPDTRSNKLCCFLK